MIYENQSELDLERGPVQKDSGTHSHEIKTETKMKEVQLTKAVKPGLPPSYSPSSPPPSYESVTSLPGSPSPIATPTDTSPELGGNQSRQPRFLKDLRGMLQDQSNDAVREPLFNFCDKHAWLYTTLEYPSYVANASPYALYYADEIADIPSFPIIRTTPLSTLWLWSLE